jgi:ATP-dependent Clp protease ATP-binding subunit ClpC
MVEFSNAVKLAVGLAAAEAERLEATELEGEHVALGLWKLCDVAERARGASPPGGVPAADWEASLDEAGKLAHALAGCGFPITTARRTLRGQLFQARRETGTFGGHRSPACRAVFDQAGRWSPLSISSTALCCAILLAPSEQLDRLFSGLDLDRHAVARNMAQSVGLDIGEGEIAGGEREGEAADGKRPERGSADAGEAGDASAGGRASRKTPKAGGRQRPTKPAPTPLLDALGRDLSAAAEAGELHAVIGRDEEIRALARILPRKSKANAIVIGEPGVGKTAVVEGLAQRLLDEDAHPLVRDVRIVEITMTNLISGASHQGEFEERVQTLIREATSDPNLVLFIDEIHTIMGVGVGAGGAMDAANMLKPALAGGRLRVIGATTVAEYRKHIEKDPAFARRFETIMVEEPTREQALQILEGLREGYERHYGLSVPDDTLEKAVELTVRYLPDRRLPDKAIDVIDQACARKVLASVHVSAGRSPHDVSLGVQDVAQIVSDRSRIPVSALTTEESERLLQMEDHLRRRVMGQDHALSVVADAMRIARAGIQRPDRPLAVFLFLGSTGTGKTELAKAMAEFLFYDKKRLITFDMSEYQEEHTVSKLIGSPPGYIGYEEEGQLTSAVRTNPYSVVLFDELEKAHPKIATIFLQICDEARLTDSHGRHVSFRDAVVVFTSNLGSKVDDVAARERTPIGITLGDAGSGGQTDRPAGDEVGKGVDGAVSAAEPTAVEVGQDDRWAAYRGQIDAALRQKVPPEVLARMQHRIIFYPLSRDTVKTIVGLITDGLNDRLASKKIHVELDDTAVELLLDRGYSLKLGARELQHAFEQLVNAPLANAILRGEIREGSTVVVSAADGRMQFQPSAQTHIDTGSGEGS